ncbi:hypothetical protein BBJ28_00015417 [Nothophytophthora sp. Chile5]|nr:hypothetical protein BBJ28_00015417 [Nothophytophthora sp. Chile5]
MSPSSAEKADGNCSPVGGRFRMRSLRPVAARIVSYGREAQAHRRTTLYVLRVSRSGSADWYVAKRYSEFRVLHEALLRQFPSDSKDHSGCCACEELESFYASVHFPDRHILQSGFGFSKKRLEATRMEELDGYVRFLLETTQGLLGDDDDDDETPESGKRCTPLDLIREFLMVNDDNNTDAEADASQNESTKSDRPADEASGAPQRRHPHQLNRRNSSVASFHVRELDLVPVATEKKRASPMGDSMRNLFADDWWDPTFADVFDDCEAPPEDVFIRRQVDDAPSRPLPNPLRLIDSFPRR